VYLLFRVAAQTITIRSVHPAILILVSVALFMLLQLAIIRAASGLQLAPKVTGWLIPVFAAAVVGFMVLGTVKMPHVMAVLVASMRDTALIFFAVSLGYTLSVIVREPSLLLPVAVFAAIVDFWSVNYGPLAILLATRPQVVEAAAVQVPVLGRAMPVSRIGVGDFVFLALFFGVMYRFRMNVIGAFWLGFVLLTATMIMVIRVPAFGAVPALVPIAIAVIAANTKHLKLKREEVCSTLIVGIVLVAFLILSVVLMNKGK
jgi:hypothetical protein